MLEIKNLSSGYDGVDIIKNISLSIRSGENLFVIGPNGCGKSTLLKESWLNEPSFRNIFSIYSI